MDIPACIVISAFAITIGITLALKSFHVSRIRYLGVLLMFVTAIWACMTIPGEFIYTWAANATCSNYLGCGDGFFGFDAFEHLFFGVTGALAIVWSSERYPSYSILHHYRWKTALAVVATIALIAVVWEMLECARDALREDILHEVLRNFNLHINLLDQPTNLDTMGDLSFSILGSIMGFFLQVQKKITSES